MIKRALCYIFLGKTYYEYVDEEIVVKYLTAEEILELSLPDNTRVREVGKSEWCKWEELKEEIKAD